MQEEHRHANRLSFAQGRIQPTSPRGSFSGTQPRVIVQIRFSLKYFPPGLSPATQIDDEMKEAYLSARSIPLIRQAISCDVCGTEKKQSNHWFVAHEHSGELRLSGWNSRNRTRPGSKHLCGQTCLHKLVDDFMARLISARVAPAVAETAEPVIRPIATDARLTSPSAQVQDHFESSARLLTPAGPVRPLAALASHALPDTASGPVAVPAPVQLEVAAGSMAIEAPIYRSPAWRAEAWERERDRELRSAERTPDLAARRR